MEAAAARSASAFASELGIAYYDKLLLKRIAEESGLSGDVVEDFDEKPMRPLLLNP